MGRDTKKKKETKEKDKKVINIAFNILAIFCIALFCFSLTPKSFQNDTFYTIKIGQSLRTNGIDKVDHYSFHNLPYTYPHWLYDIATSLIFDFMGGYTGVYISTIILSIILGIILYFTTKKVTKNSLVAFGITLAQMFLMADYVAARAQLVTFILFVLEVLFIEKFLDSGKKRYAVGLIIIPILIANLHSAVFPFYFVLYMPYMGEYLISLIIDGHIIHKIYELYIGIKIKGASNKLKKASKDVAEKYKTKLVELNKIVEKDNEEFENLKAKQAEKRKRPYKLRIERKDRVKWLVLIMIICVFTGFLTPIGDMPFTYTLKIMQGNTTNSVSEHLPLTLIENKAVLISLVLMLALLIFTDTKITLRDLFMVGGLTLLSLMTRRQVSMLVLFGGIIFAKTLVEFINKLDKKGTEQVIEFMTTTIGEILTILFVFSISYYMYIPNKNAEYISKSSYPTEAVTWIKENLDYENIRLFNDYNYGSYLLLNDIPVFIDSRCDLYTPEFNGEKDENGKYSGQDIFSDYINVSSIGAYYDTKFNEYNITHVMTKSNSKLNMLISRDDKYKQVYKDDNFLIYERESSKNG